MWKRELSELLLRDYEKLKKKNPLTNIEVEYRIKLEKFTQLLSSLHRLVIVIGLEKTKKESLLQNWHSTNGAIHARVLEQMVENATFVCELESQIKDTEELLEKVYTDLTEYKLKIGDIHEC